MIRLSDAFDKILSASKEPYAMEKAIAHYLCRELIEDLHANYNISQEEMKAINKKCVDRAYAVIKALSGDELALKGDYKGEFVTLILNLQNI